MKKNKIKLILLTSSVIAIGSLPFLAFSQTEKTLNNTKNVETTDDGFNLLSSPVNQIDAEILWDSFKGVNYFPELTAAEPTEGAYSGRIAKNPKNFIHSPYFTINFIQTTDSNPFKIVTASLQSEASRNVRFYNLPQATTEVLSAQMFGTKLWIILNIGTVEAPNYGLSLYEITNQESGTPQVKEIGGTNTSPVPLNFNLDSSLIPKAPVIIPIFSYTGNQLTARDNEMLIFQQNEKFSTVNDISGHSLIRFYTDGSSYPTSKKISIGSLPDNSQYTNSRILSILAIDNSPSGSPLETPDFDFGVYHTKGIEANEQSIVYSSFESNNYKKEVHGENIGNLNNVYINAQMPYPKIINSNTGYELFWIFARDYSVTPGESGGRIFSTSLDNNFIPLDQNQQAAVINLSSEEKWSNIRFIDYRNEGNFTDGTIYIPVKFQGLDTIQRPGLINWKDTSNSNYWNDTNEKIVLKIEDLWIKKFNDAGQEVNKPMFNHDMCLNSAYLQKIDVKNNEFTYLFNNVDRDFPRAFYRQTYSIYENNNNQDFRLSYNTQTPNEIVINKHYDVDTTTEKQNEILRDIKNYSNDFIKSNDFLEANNQIKLVPGSLKIENINNYSVVKAQIFYPKGIFQNGIYNQNGEKPVDVTLYEQPIGQSLPLKVNIDVKPEFNDSGDDFAKGFNEKIPNGVIDAAKYQELIENKTLGKINSGATVEISEPYLERIVGMKAISDSFIGNVDIELSFLGFQNFEERVITLKNFFSFEKQSLIDKEKQQEERLIIIISSSAGVVLFTIVLFTVILVSKSKRKKGMLGALQAGMSLNQKIQNQQADGFDPSNIKKPLTSKLVLPNKTANVSKPNSDVPKKPSFPKK